MIAQDFSCRLYNASVWRPTMNCAPRPAGQTALLDGATVRLFEAGSCVRREVAQRIVAGKGGVAMSGIKAPSPALFHRKYLSRRVSTITSNDSLRESNGSLSRLNRSLSRSNDSAGMSNGGLRESNDRVAGSNNSAPLSNDPAGGSNESLPGSSHRSPRSNGGTARSNGFLGPSNHFTGAKSRLRHPAGRAISPTRNFTST
jgi:hypothetical protein